MCASPESMAKTDLIKATSQCYPTPTPPTTAAEKPSTTLKTILTPQLNQSISKGKNVQMSTHLACVIYKYVLRTL